MSWWSDGERFDEYDPDYCAGCTRGFTKEECDRCMKRHEQEESDEAD